MFTDISEEMLMEEAAGSSEGRLHGVMFRKPAIITKTGFYYQVYPQL
jgi:hypothetical protein